MRKYALSAVCLLVFAGMSFAAGAPLKQESCGNVSYEDKTWLLGMAGHTEVYGSPAESRTEKDRELGHYIVQVRKWNSTQVSKLWFRSWRDAKVAEQYQKAADEIDSALEFWKGMSPSYKRYASQTAASYRQIAELLTISTNTDRTVMAEKASAILAKLEETETAATGSSQISVLESYALVSRK